MTDRKLWTLVALGGVAWYLTTPQNQPLVASVPGVPSVPARPGDRLSLVTPSYTTNTAATNVNNLAQGLAALLNHAVNAVTGVLTIGNRPVDGSAPFNGQGVTGNAPASVPGSPSVGAEKAYRDPILDADPFFGWDLGGSSGGIV